MLSSLERIFRTPRTRLDEKVKPQSTFSTSAHKDRSDLNCQANAQVSSRFARLLALCADCFRNILKPNI